MERPERGGRRRMKEKREGSQHTNTGNLAFLLVGCTNPV